MIYMKPNIRHLSTLRKHKLISQVYMLGFTIAQSNLPGIQYLGGSILQVFSLLL